VVFPWKAALIASLVLTILLNVVTGSSDASSVVTPATSPVSPVSVSMNA
jgi:hypothetical protein